MPPLDAPTLTVGGPCPEGGSVKYRLNPDIAMGPCSECDRMNEATAVDCWECGASLNQHRVLRYRTPARLTAGSGPSLLVPR